MIPQCIEMNHARAMARSALPAMLHYEVIDLVLRVNSLVPTAVVCHVCAIYQHSHTEQMPRVVQPGTIQAPCVECMLAREIDFEYIGCDPKNKRATTIMLD